MASRGKRDTGETAHITGLYLRIYNVVRRIPRGAVATYGQVAGLADIPNGGRVAGAAMRASTPDLGLPWHRVIGKRSRTMGKISILDPVGAGIQQAMLEDEGVQISPAGSISLTKFGWLPSESRQKRR